MTDANHEVQKSDDQWRQELTEEQFCVARQKGTERAFTGKYWDLKDPGVYACVCCGQKLYSSEAKFDSGSGWPSFYEAVETGVIAQTPDHSHGMARTELTCSKCGAHLGHIFDDGPAPTGKRHCINSASLNFIPAEQAGE